MSIISDINTARFLRHFFLKSLACLGFTSGIIQLIIIFQPTFATAFQGFVPFALVTILCFIIGAVASWPRPLEMECDAPKIKMPLPPKLWVETGSNRRVAA